MSTAVQRPELPRQPGSPDQRAEAGDVTRRSSGARRVMTALGVVLAMLLGSVVAVTAPAGADAPSFPVVATVSVQGAFGVAVRPDGLRAYVASFFSSSVSVINTSTNEVVATVAVGDYPQWVAVSADGSRVYVASGDGSVSVINTTTNTSALVGSVDSPAGVAVSPDGSRLYVANSSSDSVSVLNTATSAVVTTVAVGDVPLGVAVSPDGSRLYVANSSSDSVSVLNTATNMVVTTVAVGRHPWGVAVSPDGSRVYATNDGGSSVSVLNTATNTVVATVSVDSNPIGVAVSPDGSRVYAASGSGSMSVIDTATNTVVATVLFATNSMGVAASPDGSRVYVTEFGDGVVSVLSVPSSVTAPEAPTSLNATPGDGSVSVSFTAGSDGGAAISNYEYQLNGAGSWVALSPAATTSPITISGLTNGTAYTVKLRAVNVVGSGAASDASGSFTPRTTPGAPSITSVTPGDSTVSVAFSAGTTGGSVITGYEYQLNGAGSWFSLGTTSSPASIGATNGVAYTVKLRAVNVVGSGAASDASGSFTPRTTPSAPTSLNATPGDGSASISFTAGADGGAAISKYQFSTDGGSTWADAVGTTSPVTIPGLTNYTAYTVKLRAVNTAGDGAASLASGSVTPAATGPTTCSMWALGKYSIQTCWNPLVPVQGKTNRYRAYVYVAGTNTRVASCKGSVSDTGCVVKGGGGKLSASTDYDVRVRARVQIAPRQVFWSLYTDPVRVTTAP